MNRRKKKTHGTGYAIKCIAQRIDKDAVDALGSRDFFLVRQGDTSAVLSAVGCVAFLKALPLSHL